MNYISIKNKKGTTGKDSKKDSKCDSWLDFWENKKGENATLCKVYGCSDNAKLGGHVIKHKGHGKEYILPMCYSCNNKTDDAVFKALESNLVSVK